MIFGKNTARVRTSRYWHYLRTARPGRRLVIARSRGHVRCVCILGWAGGTVNKACK